VKDRSCCGGFHCRIFRPSNKPVIRPPLAQSVFNYFLVSNASYSSYLGLSEIDIAALEAGSEGMGICICSELLCVVWIKICYLTATAVLFKHSISDG
jgi:hypothetical protein